MTGRAVAMSREWESGSRDRKSSRLFSKGCCFSVAKSCPTFCDPMDCRMPGFLVLHCLPEFAQTHIHWVGNAIQPSHPLPSFSPFAFNLSQHQGLLQWVSSSPSGGQSIGASASASVLPINIQDWFPLGLTGLISLPTRDSQQSSPTLQFKNPSSWALSFLYGPILTPICD